MALHQYRASCVVVLASGRDSFQATGDVNGVQVAQLSAGAIELRRREVGWHVGEDGTAKCVGGCAQLAPGGQVGGTLDSVDPGRPRERELNCSRGRPKWRGQPERQRVSEK